MAIIFKLSQLVFSGFLFFFWVFGLIDFYLCKVLLCINFKHLNECFLIKNTLKVYLYCLSIFLTFSFERNTSC